MTLALKQDRRNQAAFDRSCEYYLNRPLLFAELSLLRLYKDRWSETDMLDLGVGTGRTALTFSILAKSYVGLDYAPRMIDACKSLIGESEHVRFVVGDAADLSRYHGRRFDLVLFSFNGIDCVNYEQRLKILGEVRKVLNPDGHFFFSSHNLHVYPFSLKWPRKGGVSLARWAYRCCWKLAWFLKQRYFNRRVGVAEARKKGWAMIADGEHGFGCRYCYITPAFQVQQLEEAAFEVVAAYGADGQPVDWRTPTDDSWLHYLCRPRRP